MRRLLSALSVLFLAALLQGAATPRTSTPPDTAAGRPPMSVSGELIMAQNGYGSRCATRIGVCALSQPGPIGHACICMFALGPMPGHIVP